jgi:hypothetical protein
MTIDSKPTVTIVADPRESTYTAILSVPAFPTETYPDRLAYEASKAGASFPEQILFRGAQSDPELLRRISLIHRWLCTTPLGEFTEVIERRLAAQKAGQRHVA